MAPPVRQAGPHTPTPPTPASEAPLPGQTTDGQPVPDLDAYWDLSDAGKKSPTLTNQYRYLKSSFWSFQFSSGEGTFTDLNNKRIVIDVSALRDANGNWDAVTRPLAHEIGHALHTYPENPTVDDKLTGEGHAVLNELKVRDEILSAAGPDVGFTGSTDRNDTLFRSIYNEWKSGRMSQQEAAYRIGQKIADYQPSTCPSINYRTFYESGCP